MRQWNDYSYKYEGGESILDVRNRYNKCVNCLQGSHITALCAYMTTYNQFQKVKNNRHWIVLFTFEEDCCCSIISYDLFTKSIVSWEEIK